MATEDERWGVGCTVVVFLMLFALLVYGLATEGKGGWPW